MSAVSTIMGATTGAILVFSDERRVFTRERSNKLYTVLSYFIGKTFAELPVFFIAVNLYCVIIYYSCELNDMYSWQYFAFSKLYFILKLNSWNFTACFNWRS